MLNKIAWLLLIVLVAVKLLGWVTIAWLPIIIFAGVLVLIGALKWLFILLVFLGVHRATKRFK